MAASAARCADLLTSLSSLAAEKRFDHVIVESSGISEPLPVAETFTFRDKATRAASMMSRGCTTL